ncbi:helix-turn-helix transcriptional regulator [Singulisphaera rosea]
MAKSQRLRLPEIRAAFRLVGECRELGLDPLAWRIHALEGLCRLIGADSANGGEAKWPRREGSFRLILPVDFGYTTAQLALYEEFMRHFGPNQPLIIGAMRKMKGEVATQPRVSLIDEKIWRKSDFYGLCHDADQGHDLFSFAEDARRGMLEAIILHRNYRRPDFGERDRRLVNLFQSESGPLLGTALARAEGNALATLSPRLRQTLELLLEGDTEKQIASRLRLSRPTIHEYVTELYRRLGVATRAELLSLFIRRRPTERNP